MSERPIAASSRHPAYSSRLSFPFDCRMIPRAESDVLVRVHLPTRLPSWARADSFQPRQLGPLLQVRKHFAPNEVDHRLGSSSAWTPAEPLQDEKPDLDLA